jgi:hypothetical protein
MTENAPKYDKNEISRDCIAVLMADRTIFNIEHASRRDFK